VFTWYFTEKSLPIAIMTNCGEVHIPCSSMWGYSDDSGSLCCTMHLLFFWAWGTARPPNARTSYLLHR